MSTLCNVKEYKLAVDIETSSSIHGRQPPHVGIKDHAPSIREVWTKKTIFFELKVPEYFRARNTQDSATRELYRTLPLSPLNV